MSGVILHLPWNVLGHVSSCAGYLGAQDLVSVEPVTRPFELGLIYVTLHQSL